MKNAGFDIIATATTNVDAKEGVCLGHKMTQFGDEWVTWAFTEREDGPSFYWGHYFREAKVAKEDYYHRIGRGY